MNRNAASLESELASLMAQIDAIDDELAVLLGRRFHRSRRIGDIKKSLAMASTDPARIADQINRFVGQAAANGVRDQFADRLIRAMIDQVVAERISSAKSNYEAQS